MDLARHYRQKFDIPVVGITGSVGKTTTKELTWAVLSAKYNTLKTQGNLNNEIGLPHTLFGLSSGFGAAVIEMGMSNLGEISRLSMTALPTNALITNIGVSHMETLGSRDNILKAKLEIVDGLQKGGTLAVNGDDDKLSTATEECVGCKILQYGIENKSAAITAQDIRQLTDGMSFCILYKGEKFETYVPAVGRHIVYDALAAFAAGILCGIEPSQCASALGNYSPSGMRQKMVPYGGATMIEDCYNASPDSMRASLEALSSMPGDGRRIAVLGDMLELGSISDESHRNVGAFAAQKAVDMLFCFGGQAHFIATGAKDAGLLDVRMFKDKSELAIALKNEIKPGDTVLVKASRGMRFEDILKIVYGEC